MTTTPLLTFRIESLERAERPSSYSLVLGREALPAAAGWDARVRIFANGKEVAFMHLDRLDGDEGWHVSAEFRNGSSMPRFMNGLFSRCTIPTIASGDLAATLDAAAAERA